MRRPVYSLDMNRFMRENDKISKIILKILEVGVKCLHDIWSYGALDGGHLAEPEVL